MLVLRSCHEYLQSGLTQSGTYNIDPDGVNIGEPPFEVECDFTAGTTEVLHDKLLNTRVPLCTAEDCFRLDIGYPTSARQLINLVDISEECTQDIRVNTVVAGYNESLGTKPIIR